MSIFDDKYDAIINAEDTLFASLAQIDEQLAREIIKIYARFVQSGQLTLDIEKLAGLEDSIIAAISKTDYKQSINTYIPNFDVINELDKKIHKQVNNIDIQKVIEENEKIANFRELVASQLKGTPSTMVKVVDVIDGQRVVRSLPIRNSSLDDLINPIANIIRKDIITGISFEQATEQILQAIKDKELGLEQWAGQIARDALSQASGVTNNEVRKEFDLKWVKYIGSIKQTTRPLCYHLLTEQGATFKYDDLQKILDPFVRDGVPSDSTTSQTANGKPQKKGGGIVPGTVAENFLIYKGGYRCRHEAVASSTKPKGLKEKTIDEPKEVVFKPAKTIKEAEERMKDAGVKVFRKQGWNLKHTNAMLEAVETVPKAARPDIVTNFTQYSKVTGRKLSTRQKQNFGVKVSTDSIKLTKIELTKELKEKFKTFESQYKDVGILYSDINTGNFQVVAINVNKYKNPVEIVARKRKVQGFFMEKSESYYIESALKNEKFTHFHELGHVFDARKNIIGKKDSLHWALDRWHKQSKIGHLAFNRSAFGVDGYKEAFADAFADYYLTGGENLPDYVFKEMDKLLK